MADNDKKKYYWIKLDKGFFKRHDIRIIESMPNGKDYILFYLKLLCESTSHEGYLRFNETIPYSEEMLATITNTNVDIVRNAVNVFTELNMMEILSDGTYFMAEVQRITGSETGNARRKREYRNNKKSEIGTSLGQCPLESESEKESEIEIEDDIDKDKGIEMPNPIKNSIVLRLLKNKFLNQDDPLEGFEVLFERLIDHYDYESVNIVTDYVVSKAKGRIINNKLNYIKTSIENNLEKYNRKVDSVISNEDEIDDDELRELLRQT